MKKLYILCVGMLFSFQYTFSQYVDSLWNVDDKTKMVYSLPLFDSLFVDSLESYLHQSDDSSYVLNWPSSDILQVEYTKPSDLSLWPSLEFLTCVAKGETGNKFTKNLQGESVSYDYLSGYSVNMTRDMQRKITFEIQTESSVNCLAALVDIQGKKANAVEAKVLVNATIGGVDTADESKWQTISMVWSPHIQSSGNYGIMRDELSEYWWERTTEGHRNDVHYLDSSAIAGVYLFMDPAGFGSPGQTKEFFIRNVIIGTQSLDNMWRVCDRTQQVESLSVTADYVGFSSDRINTTQSYVPDVQTEMVHIQAEKKQSSSISEYIEFVTVDGVYDTNTIFTHDEYGLPKVHDTVTGYSVDFSNPNNRMCHFKVQSSHNAIIHADLIDVNGKVSTVYTPQVVISETQGGIDGADESKWDEVSIQWDSEMSDNQSTEWWHVSNAGYRNEKHVLDSNKIVGVRLYIDRDSAHVENEKNVYIKDLSLGMRKVFAIEDVYLHELLYETQINLSEYYTYDKNPVYTVQVEGVPHIQAVVNDDVLSVTVEDSCIDFSNRVLLTIQDDITTFQQEFFVHFSTHHIQKPMLQTTTFTEDGESVLLEWQSQNNSHVIDEYGIYSTMSSPIFVQSTENTYALLEKPDVTQRFAVTAFDICSEESAVSNTMPLLYLDSKESDTDITLFWDSLYNLNFSYSLVAGMNGQLQDTISRISASDTSIQIPNTYSAYRLCVHNTVTDSIVSKSNIVTTKTDLPQGDIASHIVYPNPATDFIRIDVDKSITSILLISVDGTGYTKNIDTIVQNQFSIQSIPAGLYMIEVYCIDGTVLHSTFIKK
ncbi:MAG: T9SS type A sorting domain-containing protein [Bacteroidales bacterium]